MADKKHTQHILSKQRSWSPDISRDLEWQKLKTKQRHRFNQLCRSKSTVDDHGGEVTDDDVKELKACFDLGFGFDKLDDMDPKLTSAFPALELYAAVKRGYNGGGMLSRSSSSISTDSCSSSSSSVATTSIVDPSDDPQKVKAKLKQWAQLVGCSIQETSSNDDKNVAQ